MRTSFPLALALSALAGCAQPLHPSADPAAAASDPRSNPPCFGAADGSLCDDGDPCTRTDQCQQGVCVGGNPLVCFAADDCHVAGACDPATGQCSAPAAPDGTLCSVADGRGQCLAGACSTAACRADLGGAGDAQLACSGGYLTLSESQTPIVQTFTAGAGGQLGAVEVGLRTCNSAGSATVQLAVSDEQGQPLASATVGSDQLPRDCAGSGLSAGSITAALFDLRATCLPVQPGQKLSMTLRLLDVIDDSCDLTAHHCVVATGRSCFGDAACAFSVRVDDSAGNLYTGGYASAGGTSYANLDLTFQSFVY